MMESLIEVIIVNIINWNNYTSRSLSSTNLIKVIDQSYLGEYSRENAMNLFSFIIRILVKHKLAERIEKGEFVDKFPYHYKILESLKSISYSSIYHLIRKERTSYISKSLERKNKRVKEYKSESNTGKTMFGLSFKVDKITVDLRKLLELDKDIEIVLPSYLVLISKRE